MKTILYLIACAGCVVLGFIGCSTQRETMRETSTTSTTHSQSSSHPTGMTPTSGYGSGGSRGY